MQRQLDLDQATYYSRPNYAEDAAGKAKLDAELQRRQYLQSEIERLKDELTAPKTKQIAKQAVWPNGHRRITRPLLLSSG